MQGDGLPEEGQGPHPAVADDGPGVLQKLADQSGGGALPPKGGADIEMFQLTDVPIQLPQGDAPGTLAIGPRRVEPAIRWSVFGFQALKLRLVMLDVQIGPEAGAFAQEYILNRAWISSP